MKTYLILLLICISFCTSAQVASHAVSVKDVKFESSGVVLEGVVMLPKNAFAAVVMVHGSGLETRMLGMSSFLANHGIAVLTYDKRGVGKSKGVYVGPEVGTNNIDSTNLEQLADDVNVAFNMLVKNLPSKDIPLGLVGFSQAGWVIPISAAKNNRINFMVIFSGPVVTTLEQLRFQFYTNGDPKFWETHTEADARAHIQNDPDRYQFAETDPRKPLLRLNINGLWIFGGKDIQAPVGLSIERLSLLKAQGKAYEYYVFPNLGHNTSLAKSQEPGNAVVQWIRKISISAKGR